MINWLTLERLSRLCLPLQNSFIESIDGVYHVRYKTLGEFFKSIPVTSLFFKVYETYPNRLWNLPITFLNIDNSTIEENTSLSFYISLLQQEFEVVFGISNYLVDLSKGIVAFLDPLIELHMICSIANTNQISIIAHEELYSLDDLAQDISMNRHPLTISNTYCNIHGYTSVHPHVTRFHDSAHILRLNGLKKENRLEMVKLYHLVNNYFEEQSEFRSTPRRIKDSVLDIILTGPRHSNSRSLYYALGNEIMLFLIQNQHTFLLALLITEFKKSDCKAFIDGLKGIEI